jgi:hypothetical protein
MLITNRSIFIGLGGRTRGRIIACRRWPVTASVSAIIPHATDDGFRFTI